MEKKKLFFYIRSLLLIAAGVLILMNFKFPMWGIELYSNNYPNGIGMAIYSTHPDNLPYYREMDGGMRELNVLNHYIGMKKITKDMWQFKVIPALLILAAISCFVAAFLKKKWASFGAVVVNAAVGAVGIGVLLYTLYQYGHDLNPEAAIKVPPFMPGIIGENHLAQFTTYSFFDWGTYVVLIGAGLTVLAFLIDYFIVFKNQ